MKTNIKLYNGSYGNVFEDDYDFAQTEAVDHEVNFNAFNYPNEPNDYYYDRYETHYGNDISEDYFDEAEILREVMHENYSNFSPEEMQQALDNILETMTPQESFNFKKALYEIGKATNAVRKNKMVGQIVQKGLPVAGAAIGTIYGGPVGTAIGGQLGNVAAQAFVSNPGTRNKRATKQGNQYWTPHSPHGSSSGGSAAATKLLQLTQNPDVLKSLLSLSLGSHGKQAIKTTANGKNVNNIDILKLIGKLVNEAESDAIVIMEEQLSFNHMNDRSNNDSMLLESSNEAIPLAAVSLGFAVFQFAHKTFTGGGFNVESASSSYIHPIISPYAPLSNFSSDFKLTAHHPRYFIDNPNLWFNISFEYNGNDIMAANIVPLRSKSTSLTASTFSVNFSPQANSATQDLIAKIRYMISGNWDPIGRGDVSFRGYIDIDAQGNVAARITHSEENWVQFAGFHNVIRKILKKRSYPKLYKHIIYFVPSGSYRIKSEEIKKLHEWLKTIGRNPRVLIERIKNGEVLIKLAAFASTTASIGKNQLLARKRADNVETLLRDFVGMDAKIKKEVNGELKAKTRDNFEEPNERRVEIEILE